MGAGGTGEYLPSDTLLTNFALTEVTTHSTNPPPLPENDEA